MTNATPSSHHEGPALETRAHSIARVTWRPVKVVQHPAFRAAAGRTAATRRANGLRVVSLNALADSAATH